MLIIVAFIAILLAYSALTSPSVESNLRQATVVRVVDGDTLVVDIDGEGERKVRLIGIDTPESVHPERDKNSEDGVRASEHTEEILPPGTVVWLERDVSDTDAYDRLLRYVWLEEPDDQNDPEEVRDKMLNARLVADGWARAVDYPPDTKWSDVFHDL